MTLTPRVIRNAGESVVTPDCGIHGVLPIGTSLGLFQKRPSDVSIGRFTREDRYQEVKRPVSFI